MVANIFMGFILLCIGGVMFAGSFLNLNLFFSLKRVSAVVKLFGRGRARVFFFILGNISMVIGIAGAVGFFVKYRVF